MRRLTLPLFAAVTLVLAACDKPGVDDAPQDRVSATAGSTGELALDSVERQVGYTVGFQLGQTLRQDGLVLDPRSVGGGVADALEGKAPRISGETMQSALSAYQQSLREERTALAEENRAKGEAFLATNKLKDGVTTLDSGLQYEVVRAGTGKTPGTDSTVRVNYRGTLIDGTEFDSSERHGEPATLAVENVIAGWQEALPKMQEGALWRIVIPHDLAYGAKGAGDAIGPNETLVFEIELLEVKDNSTGP